MAKLPATTVNFMACRSLRTAAILAKIDARCNLPRPPVC